MTGQLNAAQRDWLADFVGLPWLAQSAPPPPPAGDVSEDPPPPSSPYATAPVGTSSAAIAAAPDPPPSGPASDVSEDPPEPSSPAGYAPAGTPSAGTAAPPEDQPTIETDKPEFVQPERLAELDAAVASGLLDLMKEAKRQANVMQAIAALHGVDLEHPEAALAPLKQEAASALDEHTQTELKLGLGVVNAAGDTMNDALISFREESMTLRRSLEAVHGTPGPTVAKTEENDPGDDDKEHAFDASVQGLKFLSELPAAILAVGATLAETIGGYVSTALELVGMDVWKDQVKGGNSDELLASLKTVVDELQGTVNDLVTELKRNAAKQAADAAETLTSRTGAVLREHGHFVGIAKQFDGQLKAAMAKAMASKGGMRPGPSEHSKGIMAVHQAVQDASKAQAEAAVALAKQGTVVGDLRYWESMLVPLGKRVHDGQIMAGDANDYMIYAKGSRRIAFILPSGGLKNSLEDLSSAVQVMRKFDPGGSEIEKLSDGWMSAMVDAL